MDASNQDNLENYCHKDWPNGTRYVGLKGFAPAWAADIQPGDGKPRNHLGLPIHVTDEFVHYRFGEVEGKKLMGELREIWDRAENDRATTDDIRFMIDLVTKNEQHDAAAAASVE